MAQGNVLDFAWARPAPSLLKASGIVAVNRYLSWLPNGKVISKAEATSYLKAGIDIHLNWEFQATDELGGAKSGLLHGNEAIRQAKLLGYPKGATIYFSGDFDETPAQATIVMAYFNALRPAMRAAGYRIGAYGGYYLVKRLFDTHNIDDGWQAYAWSGGQWDSRAHMHQIHNGYPFHGYDVDLNTRVGPTYSWLHPWVAPKPVVIAPKPAPVPVPKPLPTPVPVPVPPTTTGTPVVITPTPPPTTSGTPVVITPLPAPAPAPATVTGDDMKRLVLASDGPGGPVYLGDFVSRRWIKNPVELANVQWWIKRNGGDPTVYVYAKGTVDDVLGVLIGPDAPAPLPVEPVAPPKV